MIDNIENMWEQINPKRPFLKVFSEHTGNKVSTLKSNWFSTFAIPEDKQADTVDFMQKYIAAQNKTA